MSELAQYQDTFGIRIKIAEISQINFFTSSRPGLERLLNLTPASRCAMGQ
jgi:hypothetical protein